jgi:hypothetical protein
MTLANKRGVCIVRKNYSQVLFTKADKVFGALLQIGNIILLVVRDIVSRTSASVSCSDSLCTAQNQMDVNIGVVNLKFWNLYILQ